MSFVVRGVVRAPGDKSISHRALILAALADGETRVRDILESADVQSTASALRALGVDVPALSPDFVVRGRGTGSLVSPSAALDCGNSGTTTRLLAGVLAGLDGRSACFEGDASLSRRPMKRIAEPLSAMGARITFEGEEGHDGLPMRVYGTRLHSIDYVNSRASAQIKSALLLAGLVSGTELRVSEPRVSRDHTERMLAARGVALDVTTLDGPVDTGAIAIHLAPDQRLAAADAMVPADPSSATFFAALAALADEGEIVLEGVCLNPTRTGAFNVLRRMGAEIMLVDEHVAGGETIATIAVRPGMLIGTSICGAEIPSCIDELPMLACVAARAEGETTISDAAELRVKESDRIQAVVANLQALGVEAEERPDGMQILGSRKPLSGRVVTHGDHRLAMAFGVLAAVPGNSIVIDDPECVSVSYPGFWRDLAAVTDSKSVHGLSSAPETGGAGPGAFAARPEPDSGTEGRPLVIAIDGPAASGKSSTAQWVARDLGVRHVDSGAFYRAITLLALELPVAPDDWSPEAVLSNSSRISWRLTHGSVMPLLDGQEVDAALRDQPVTREVSRVARMQPVRSWVNEMVRAAGSAVDVVVDGRDIGTTVFPDAQLKIFLTADPWERARRRLVQRLGRRPSDAEIALGTEELVARDARDATQSVPARDAITIDTTTLAQEEQVARIIALARAARERMGS